MGLLMLINLYCWAVYHYSHVHWNPDLGFHLWVKLICLKIIRILLNRKKIKKKKKLHKEFNTSPRYYKWTIKKINGGQNKILRAKFIPDLP